MIYNKIIWAEGNCGWLKPETHFNAKIDEEGKIDFENQLPIGMECTTRYGARVGGATTIEMDCRSNDINLTTDGFVSQTREFGFGTGVIWGNVSGCRKLYVDWQVHFAR